MRYFIDTKQELYGTEMMVFSCLQCLCSKGEWKGSYAKLAELSGCGGKTTAYRNTQTLIKNGYISFQNGTFTCSKMERKLFQNGTEALQNETILKEKEKNQKKVESKNNVLNNSESVSKEAHTHAHTCEDLINGIFNNASKEQIEIPESIMELGISEKVPASTGLYKRVIEAGYLQPKQYIKDMYDYYGSQNMTVQYPMQAIGNWMRNEKHRNKKNPSLTEAERIWLGTFLESIPQNAVCRICDLLIGFELTDKYAVLTIQAETEKVQAMDEWLSTHMDRNKMSVYNRAITYKVAPKKLF